MIQVQIDGNPLSADFGGMNNMADLIEYVKATIDPDTIITSVEFNGQVLNDGDWTTPLAAHRGRTLQIRTGTKQAYLLERMGVAPEIVQKILEEFKTAGESYRAGHSPAGNTALSTAVDDLSAFVGWYSALLDMDSRALAPAQQQFVGCVNELQTVCEQILQQQLYNSWWVLSETINTKLTPKLDDIKSLCSDILRRIGQPN